MKCQCEYAYLHSPCPNNATQEDLLCDFCAGRHQKHSISCKALCKARRQTRTYHGQDAINAQAKSKGLVK